MKDWKISRLGDVSNFEGGSQPPKSNFKYEAAKGYVRFLQIRDFGSDKNMTYIPESAKNRYCNEKDILIGRYGASVGKILTNKAGAYNVALMKTIPNEKILNKRYFYFYLISEEFQRRLSKISSRSAQDGFSKEDIYDFPIMIPPLSEQKRIVETLDEAFAAIDKAKENMEKNLHNSKALFESCLEKMFNDRREDHQVIKLENICELISKGSSPKWQGVKYVDGPGILFVTSENVGENEMLLTERKYVEEKFNIKDSKSILKPGDVLTNIVGASIGRTAIFDLDDNANINQAVCLIRCKKEFLFNQYLMYLLNSPFTRQHLHENEVNNARANLSLGFFRNLEIPVPPVKTQHLVVNQVKELDIQSSALKKLYQQKLDDLEELKKSILQKAFAGKLANRSITENA